MDNITRQTKQDIHTLSRFMGSRYAKWVTCILLLPVLFSLAPSSEYFLLLTILLPLIIQVALKETGMETDSKSALALTKQKYHFSDAKYRAEKRAHSLLLLFLCLWQYTLTQADLPSILRIYPGILIIANIISRLAGAWLFRLYLHYQFTSLNTLDDI